MTIVSIAGARPQFVKLAVVHRAAVSAGVRHRIIHTGQHYDTAMSASFFTQLGIPAPDHHLGVGSGTHGQQTGEMIKQIEPILTGERPDWVVLYGDTNSTLAGAVAASKLHIAVAHVEAGLRSFNRRMPEEINRIVADHLSDLLLCPTDAAMENLAREGLAGRACRTGDVMYDAFLWHAQAARSHHSEVVDRWSGRPFALATIHRAENTDDPNRLRPILESLEEVSETIAPVLLPLHPRTRQRLLAMNWEPKSIHLLEPVSYLEMLLLEAESQMILTDSGGVQKEAYFVERPCITLRDETEWIETLDNGCNVLAGADRAKIVAAARASRGAGPWSGLYGDGKSGEAIVEALLRNRTTAEPATE